MVEDVRALFRGARRVEADHDGADRHQRPVEQHPLERRPRQDADRVPPADAPGQEAVGELVDPPAGLVPAHRPPPVGGLGQVGGARPALGERGPPDRDRRPQLGLVRRDRRRHLPHFREGMAGVGSKPRVRLQLPGGPYAHDLERINQLRPGPTSPSGRSTASAGRRSSKSATARSTSVTSSPTSSSRAGRSRRASS